MAELKRPGTPLEAPQPSYNNRSPVEQAFDDGQNLPSCRWIVVSDMRFVRLYAVDTADEYHEIDLHADVPNGPGALQELKRWNVTYAQLVEKLAEIGVKETEVNIRHKIARGGFTAVFFVQCLEAIGVN